MGGASSAEPHEAQRRLRVLVLMARRPSNNGRGDQKRGWCWARELAKDHDVTILTLGLPDDEPDADDALPGVAMISASSSSARRARAALLGLARGIPLQTSWTIGGNEPVIAAAVARAEVVLAVTTRVLDRQRAIPIVVDHVDSLSLNMARRAEIDHRAMRRLGARLEQRLMARHERRVARFVESQLVTTREDASVLPQLPRPVVVPPHYTSPSGHLEAPQAGDRPVDVILTGNMQYPPNRRAYERLSRDVLPRLLAVAPAARVRVVGRRADTLAPCAGIEIASDVPNVVDELRRAKVAIAPVDGGTGAPTKLLEAGAAGCAVVAPTWAMDAYAIGLPGADDDAQLAQQVLALLEDPALREANARELGAAVLRCTPEALGALVTAQVERAAGA